MATTVLNFAGIMKPEGLRAGLIIAGTRSP